MEVDSIAGPRRLAGSSKAVANGVVAGDGKDHPTKMFTEDIATDRRAQVTGDLIQNSKVDIIFAGGALETMKPGAEICVAMETPGLMIQGRGRPSSRGRPLGRFICAADQPPAAVGMFRRPMLRVAQPRPFFR